MGSLREMVEGGTGHRGVNSFSQRRRHPSALQVVHVVPGKYSSGMVPSLCCAERPVLPSLRVLSQPPASSVD